MARSTHMKPTMVFVESWINSIHVRFANEFARQHPSWNVYYVTDKDAFGPHAMDTFSSRVKAIGLQNRTIVRRLVFFPLYLGSFVSQRARSAYADTLYMHTYADLAKTLDSIKPTVIQANVLVMPYTIQVARYAARHKIPFILRTEEREPRSVALAAFMKLYLVFARSAVRTAALVLPWTKQGLSFARSQLHVRPDRLALLPAGVDMNMFNTKGRRSATQSLRLLAVQRFVPYKDYPTLLRGVRVAIDGGLRCSLTIIGWGPDERSVRALVDELGLQHHVHFRKPVSYDAMPALYREHDVLIHTGQYEAIGMAVPESMACGVTPVVCDTAGAITYVTPSTGFIFKTGDAHALGKALVSLTPGRVRSLGARASEHIKRHYTIPRIVQEHAVLLTKRLSA